MRDFGQLVHRTGDHAVAMAAMVSSVLVNQILLFPVHTGKYVLPRIGSLREPLSDLYLKGAFSFRPKLEIVPVIQEPILMSAESWRKTLGAAQAALPSGCCGGTR